MDVRHELVSIKMARDECKVVLNPDTLEIDQHATKALRSGKETSSICVQ